MSTRLRAQELACDVTGCTSSTPPLSFPSSSSYPCKVHFPLLPLLLSSPCGVLPLQAGGGRGVGGLRESGGWRRRLVVEWGTDCGDVMCESTGTLLAGLLGFRWDRWLGSHLLSMLWVTEEAISLQSCGYLLWRAVSSCSVSVRSCVSLPSLH